MKNHLYSVSRVKLLLINAPPVPGLSGGSIRLFQRGGPG